MEKERHYGELPTIRKSKKIASILELCNQSKIEVIVLKGIVLRNLYPAADLRTMNDLDILVHEHQLKEVEDLLINQGYYKYTEDGEKHDVYIKSGWPMIEVHWMLSHEPTFKGCVEYEKSLWNRVREVEIQGVKTLTLGFTPLNDSYGFSCSLTWIWNTLLN